jgi:hypothetical protein
LCESRLTRSKSGYESESEKDSETHKVSNSTASNSDSKELLEEEECSDEDLPRNTEILHKLNSGHFTYPKGKELES